MISSPMESLFSVHFPFIASRYEYVTPLIFSGWECRGEIYKNILKWIEFLLTRNPEDIFYEAVDSFFVIFNI